ncbi:Cilia- and flagella-associated protein 54, partial [Exaiptasia diaphana]
FQNPKTVVQSITYLKILRLITQTALHKETYCWLVFNGTVHIYTICRHLMALGHSKEVLEFLLWACMCMESSVPLMTVKYLSWRCTLYSAVCHCYYDLKALTQAEAFAKRAVSKVNELEDIEKISTSETTPMSVGTFREAKAKMQIMVFKRVVFETRKRPKGLLRPKTKPNLKDSINLPWPRTPAERLLTDLFQASTSAQFLAILESLTDSHRRTLHCEPPPVDTEDTMTDVYGELFFAGLEIIAGGGGMKHQHAMKHDADIHPSVVQLGNHSLVELVRDGM